MTCGLEDELGTYRVHIENIPGKIKGLRPLTAQSIPPVPAQLWPCFPWDPTALAGLRLLILPRKPEIPQGAGTRLCLFLLLTLKPEPVLGSRVGADLPVGRTGGLGWFLVGFAGPSILPQHHDIISP